MTELETGNAPAKFPLFLLICAQLVRGSVFLFLVAPLVKIVLLDHQSRMSGESLLSLIGQFWWATFSLGASTNATPSIAVVPLWLGASLVTGFCVAPFERALCCICAGGANRFSAWRQRRPKPAQGTVKRAASVQPTTASGPKYFDPSWYTHREYVEFVDWLFDRASDKAHWEWELCHYFIYWSFPIALVPTFALCIAILPFWQLTIPALMLFASLLFAMKRSEMMQVVNEHYLCLMRRRSRIVPT